jgi:hypothetical protein
VSDSLAFFVPAPDGQPVQVEILDIYHPLCTVRALAGKPFVGGDRWPVATEYTVTRMDQIVVVNARLSQSHYPGNIENCHNLEK